MYKAFFDSFDFYAEGFGDTESDAVAQCTRAIVSAEEYKPSRHDFANIETLQIRAGMATLNNNVVETSAPIHLFHADEVVTCPHCGGRTDYEEEGTEKCLNCGYTFIVEFEGA